MHRLLTPLLIILVLLGCGKPTAPELPPSTDNTGGYNIVSRLITPGYAQDIEIRDTLAFLAQGEGGLLVVSIANPLAPHIISMSTSGTRGYSTKIALKDSIVYLAAGNYGVTVIDVTNPAVPIVTESNLAMKPARDFRMHGDYLFTSISEQGVKIADISFPAHPDIRGDITVPGYARGMWVTGDSSYLLVACGEMGFSMVNITDMQNGFGIYPLAGWIDTPGLAEAIVAKGNETYAFMACGTAGLQVIDFRDTSNIRIVGQLDPGGFAREVMYANRKVYMTTETGGLRVIDVDDVRAPRLIGTVRTKHALGVAADSNYIYVADRVEGLITISIPKN